MPIFTSFSGEPGIVQVQFQDRGGNWIPFSTCPNEWPVIQRDMQRASTLNRTARVRAVDEDGRLIDVN